MKHFFLYLCLLCALCSRAAVPTFQSFEPTQFITNNNRIAYIATHTNEAGIIYPALANDLTLITNLNSYGTFSLPSKVTLLALGTNYLDLSTNSTWLLNSPTNDATQVILSLSAGAYQGQLAFLTSQNGSNSFTLPDLSEQWDVPGAFVDIQGDWIGTTNRGIILQYTAPDWIEMARFDPGQTGGGTITGSGTPNYIPYWLNATTLADSPFVRIGANAVGIGLTNILSTDGSALVYSNSAITGTGGFYIKDNAGSLHLYMGAVAGQAHLQSSDGSAVVLANNIFGKDATATMDLGHISSAANQFRDAALSRDLYVGRNIIWNGTTNSLTDTWGAGSPEGVLPAFPGSLYRDALNGAFYGKTNGTGNTGWGLLSAGAGGGTTINSANNYIPYRLNGTTFGNSPFNFISTNRVGFFDTNVFIGFYAGGASMGLGVNAGPLVGNSTGFIAIGPNALASATGGQNSVVIGQNALFSSAASLQDVAVGVDALQNDLSGDNNVAVGYNAGDSVNGGSDLVIIGSKADTLNPGDDNSIVIGADAVGHGPNTATIGNASTVATYIGSQSTLVVGSVTKAQKTALTPVDGMIVYQTDNTPGFRGYVNGTWFIFSMAADP